MEANGAMKLQAIEIWNKWPFWAVCVNMLLLNSFFAVERQSQSVLVVIIDKIWKKWISFKTKVMY